MKAKVWVSLLALSCSPLAWDYPGHPLLGEFRIYVSQTSGDYQKGRPHVPGGYVATVPGIPEMLTSVPCEQLHLIYPGTYYAVATAMPKNLKPEWESEFSNEISFVYANASTPTQPSPPVPIPVPEIPLPSPPPPLGPSPFPTPPQPPDTGGYISDTCAWKGLLADACR
jgi:hypothetical protein